jgi:hypothetical protein
MKAFKHLTIALAASAGLFALSGVGASAAIVCSGDDCWHTHDHFDYPASAHIVVHDDSWRWADHDHYHWREHEGRGFWHGDRWEDF